LKIWESGPMASFLFSCFFHGEDSYIGFVGDSFFTDVLISVSIKLF
jgi:hypothetical protein